MPAPKNAPQTDEFERFDEAQPFLQLLADLLNRLDSKESEAEDETAEVVEDTSQ